MTTQAEVKVTTKRTHCSMHDAFMRTYGRRQAFIIENALYRNMDLYCPSYNGGGWENLKGSNGAVARVLDTDERLTLVNEDNFFNQEMSAEAATLAVFTLTVNHVSHTLGQAGHTQTAIALADHHFKLMDLVYDHPEVSDLLAFLD